MIMVELAVRDGVRERSHITSAARGVGFPNADATVISKVCPGVQLLTEGGLGRGSSKLEKSC